MSAPIQCSPDLKRFAREWCAWVDDGAPPHKVFIRRRGLEENLIQWSFKRVQKDSLAVLNEYEALIKQHFGDDIWLFDSAIVGTFIRRLAAEGQQ